MKSTPRSSGCAGSAPMSKPGRRSACARCCRTSAISARCIFPARSTFIRSITRSVLPPTRRNSARASSRTRRRSRIDPAGVRKRIDTPEARVRAAHVVLACNVQLGDLMPRLGATLLPITTFVLVTEPIPRLTEIVRYRGAVSDTNRADNHYRIVGGDRLAVVRAHAGLAGRSALGPARAARRHQAQFSRSRQSRDRASVARHARARDPSHAADRRDRERAVGGERLRRARAQHHGDGRRTDRARHRRDRRRPGGCLRPTNWSGPAACSAGWWRKASIGGARPIERIEQGLARYREQARTRKAARLAARNGQGPRGCRDRRLAARRASVPPACTSRPPLRRPDRPCSRPSARPC